jgi:hypothetical protein
MAYYPIKPEPIYSKKQTQIARKYHPKTPNNAELLHKNHYSSGLKALSYSDTVHYRILLNKKQNEVKPILTTQLCWWAYYP